MIKALPSNDRALVKEQLPILFPSGGEELMGQENTEIFSSVVPSPTKDGLRP
jgi:hypothetical protein